MQDTKYYYVLSLILLFYVPIAYSTDLIQSRTSWDGGEVFYPEGQLQITSKKLNIKKGETTRFHCHPVPTFGYVLSGVIEVETKDGRKIQFTQGESVVEVMRTVHRGKAIGGDIEIVVFYAGAVSMPNTVLPENDPEHQYCNG